MRKIALINDLSGYGRCSIQEQLPVISACGDMASLAVTQYLSNHTGYENVNILDMSDNLKKVFDMWDINHFKFDAILTGYLGNKNNINVVKEYISNQKLDNERCLLMVDPVMGDNGKKYCKIDDCFITSMKEFVKLADIITPNLTEACLLTDTDFEDLRMKLGILEYVGPTKDDSLEKKKECEENLKKVSDKIIFDLKPILDKIIYKRFQITIITGIEIFNNIVTILDIYNGDTKNRQTTCNFVKKLDNRPGTGDLFDAFFLEMLFKGYDMVDCLKITTGFIEEALKFSIMNKTPKNEGVCFEPILVPNLEYIRTHSNINNKNERK